MIKVLVDGWSLCRRPNSPQALHLWGLMSHAPPDAALSLACPQQPDVPVPDVVQPLIEPAGDSAGDVLRWQQRALNRLSQEVHADLLYLPEAAPPLFRKSPVLVAEAGYGEAAAPTAGFLQRLVGALARGGLQRGQSWLVPVSWPSGDRMGSSIPLMPFVHPEFLAAEPGIGLDLPERFVLYHGPSTEQALLELMDAWSWVAASVGDSVTLVLVDVRENGKAWLDSFLGRYQLDVPIRVMPRLSLDEIAVIYNQAEALVYPGKPKPWGSPVVHALFSGAPVVGYESAELDALVGPAGILVEERDARKLGASILTVLVNPEVRQELSYAASRRRETWLDQETSMRLGEIFREIVPSGNL